MHVVEIFKISSLLWEARFVMNGCAFGRHLQPTSRDYYSLHKTPEDAKDRYSWWADEHRPSDVFFCGCPMQPFHHPLCLRQKLRLDGLWTHLRRQARWRLVPSPLHSAGLPYLHCAWSSEGDTRERTFLWDAP